MNLTDVLDLAGALLLIAAVVAVVLIGIPAPWCWPLALFTAGSLVSALSLMISKRGAR